MASFETEKVKSPNRVDNKATFNPPESIVGSAPPVASITSKAVISPINEPITPKANPSAPLSLMCLSIFFEISLFVLRVKACSINTKNRSKIKL